MKKQVFQKTLASLPKHIPRCEWHRSACYRRWEHGPDIGSGPATRRATRCTFYQTQRTGQGVLRGLRCRAQSRGLISSLIRTRTDSTKGKISRGSSSRFWMVRQISSSVIVISRTSGNFPDEKRLQLHRQLGCP